jgi:capsule polysaccharide export protein KpsE/RkpR
VSQERFIEVLSDSDGGSFANGNSREEGVARLRTLWEHRRFLFKWLIIGSALSLVVTLLIPARYEATTQIMPPDAQSSNPLALISALTGKASSVGSAAGGIAGSLLGMKNNGALFIGVLSSRTVLDHLIEQFNLRYVYHESTMEDARKALLKHTTSTEDRKSGIISVTVTDHSPQRSAAIAQAYVDELDRVVALVSTSAARRERIFLEGRLQAVKGDLDQASRDFSQFASKNVAIDITAQGRAMVEAAAVLQGQLISAEAELQGLETIYTDQNVRVRAVRARITELKAQLQKLGGDKDTASQATATGAGGPSTDAFPTIRKLPLLGVTYYDLYRKTKIQETVFELLTQQYELAKVEEAKEIPSVKVLDPAVVPTKRSFPIIWISWLIGTVLCFLAECAWVLGRRAWTSIDPQDPGRLLAEEVAGTIRARAVRVASVAIARVRPETGDDPSPQPAESHAVEEVCDSNLDADEPLSRAARKGAM